jgi:hypothetical protein
MAPLCLPEPTEPRPRGGGLPSPKFRSVFILTPEGPKGVTKFEEPLACARGSEWRLYVRQSLPSRDREGAVSRSPKFRSVFIVTPEGPKGVTKFEEPLACARGSEWRLYVRQSLPSRDREGAVPNPEGISHL